MTPNERRLAILLAGAALTVASSLPAHAQFGGGRHGGRSQDAASPRDPQAQRGVSATDALYDVRMRLSITDAESAAWEHFYRAYLGWAALAGSRPAPPGTGALQSAQQQLTVAQNRFATTEDMAEAVKGLYALLSETQQQAADDLLPKLLALTAPAGERITAR